MRGLLWRALAVTLGGCVSWLLWNWPEPSQAEAVEYALIPDCADLIHPTPGEFQCWQDGTVVTYRPRK